MISRPVRLRHVPFLVTALLLTLAGSVPVSASLSFPNTRDTLGPHMVHQLDLLTRSNLARVAGRDTNLPSRVNGHDEFIAQWTAEMRHSLRGLPIGVYHQPFETPGFVGLPAKERATNTLVVVPGTTRSQQSVLVGAHFDGEPFSKGSTYDDASGSTILLALARSFGTTWRQGGLPQRAVIFALFDAEEQGLVGSSALGFAMRHDAVIPKPVLMIDEEQSGVGYPVRPFGLASRTPLPSYAFVGAEVPGYISRYFGSGTPPDNAALSTIKSQLRSARPVIFSKLRKSYLTLSLRGGKRNAFTTADTRYLRISGSDICCSDDAPFAAVGIPTTTFAGDASYYDRHPSSWAFPFDQPQDTLPVLSCDTGGSSKPGASLEAALALPERLSEALLSRYAPTSRYHQGLALLSDAPQAGRPTHFTVVGSNSASWRFGDGMSGRGSAPSHAYRRAGTYKLTITGRGIRQTWSVKVARSQPAFHTPIGRAIHPPPIRPWHPAELKGIEGCP